MGDIIKETGAQDEACHNGEGCPDSELHPFLEVQPGEWRAVP